MDAVDRLVSATDALQDEIKDVRREVANKRKRDAAMMVSLILLLLGTLVSFLFDHVAG